VQPGKEFRDRNAENNFVSESDWQIGHGVELFVACDALFSKTEYLTQFALAEAGSPSMGA
jgi:hypothetical protein